MVRFFWDLTAEQALLAGGKGRALARLYQAGHHVPNGFVILTTAFDGDALKPAAWEQVRGALVELRAGQADRALAVRSSALSEDSAQASFAGEFETVLDVRDDDGLRRAIETVRRSRHASRVGAYSRAQGLGPAHDVAVVVQQLVRPDFSGVIFTADPVTGSRMAVVGNFVRGLGERLVAGEATASSFTLRRPRGDYEGPPELRPFARQLYRAALRIEHEFGAPQDLEWAIAGGRLALLQARPITTLRGHDLTTGEWNDSLTGDYLWTSANVGEAIPDVMTPCTWSFVQRFMEDTLPLSNITGYPLFGNIGGRFYLNLSVMASLAAVVGIKPQRFARLNEPIFGRIPEGVEVPLIPMPRWRSLAGWLPRIFNDRWSARTNLPRLPAFLATAPARCDALRARIKAVSSAAELLDVWRTELQPFFRECCQMLHAAATPLRAARSLRAHLSKRVGEGDANALLSGMGEGAGHLASLGPLLGLGQLARGEIDRETYARQYGHRSPHEFEVSRARPAEDPEWIDRQLAGLREAPVEVAALVARQQSAHAAAWERYRQRYPREARSTRRRIDQIAATIRDREAARSEMIRGFWALRTFVQRAGALTGQGEVIFFLTIDEILALLGGEGAALAWIPARRETYARYSALPPYPGLIRGRFDPLKWAADPRRRSDLFDVRGDFAPASDAITGFPGAAGVVEGQARVVASVEEGDQLRGGEILVTVTTNIGWTPLFPRAAAIVTDVGAPLSHAAIVARELGIPAVVGCGNATMRLRTGDQVRVNGASGTVEVLRRDGAPPPGSAPREGERAQMPE